MNPIELGKFIANLRNEKNLTQEELAEKLYIDKKKVSRWECGTSTPEFELLIKLSEILDVSLYELSICQRINSEKISTRILNKFKNIKDLRKLSIKRIIKIIIILILAVFFTLTTIYTFKNNGTVEIYELESLDPNYSIEGHIIRAKEFNSLNIINISFLENEKDELNHLKNNCIYEIYNNDVRVLYLSEKKQIINNTDIDYNDTIKAIENHNDNLKVNIVCSINNTIENYNFKFRLIKKYDNKFI